MLRKIVLENFKSIGVRTAFELSDITLLYGPNSAGKSSILHALRYAYELIVNDNPDPMTSNTDGHDFYLGGFRKLVHKRDLTKQITMYFEFDVVDEGRNADHSEFCRTISGQYELPKNLAAVFEKLRKSGVEDIDEGGCIWPFEFPEHYQCGLLPLTVKPETFSIAFVVGWNRDKGRAALVDIMTALNGKPLMSFMPDSSAEFYSDCIGYFPVFDFDFDQYSEKKPFWLPNYRDFDQISEPGKEPKEDWIRAFSDIGFDSPPDDELIKYTEAVKREKATELKTLWLDIKNRAKASVGEPWTDTARRLLANLNGTWQFHQLGRQQCLSSAGFWGEETLLSEYAEQDFRDQVGGSKDDETWRNQAAAFNTMVTYLSTLSVTVRQNFQGLLEQILHIGPLRESNIAVSDEKGTRSSWFTGEAAWYLLYRDRGTATDESPEEDEISAWLCNADRFDTGYRIVRNDSKLLKETDCHKLLSEQSTQEREELISNLETQSTVTIVDRHGLNLRTVEVGTGISQLVPIIVAAIHASENALIAIEQPELHLHPKSQLVISDLLISSIGAGKQFIVETHSEHLALRLLRRIRETTAGEAPDKLSLTPEKVAINYALPTDEGLKLMRLRVDETGEFLDRWPSGFFDERAEELF